MEQLDRKIRSITIDFIPEDQMRYHTLGDWLFDGFGNLHIKVVDTKDIKVDLPIAIHELIEAVLCKINRISQFDVDMWDLSYDEIDVLNMNKPDEPGEHPEAPYFKEHRIACNVEDGIVFAFTQNKQ